MQATVKEERDKYIGGSDIPAIMDISPFLSRYDLLLLKAGIKESEFEGNQYTDYGNKMEARIRDFINSDRANKFVEDKIIKGDIRCHTDGYNGEAILEIKTTSQVHKEVNEYKVYLVQLLFYMINYNISEGILAVYNRPEDFNEEFDKDRLQIFKINIEDYKDLCMSINKAVDSFRIDLARIKENPLLTESDLIPVDIKDLVEEVIKLENQLEAYKEIEKKSKELKTKIYEAMVNEGIKKWETPNGMKITVVNATEDKTELVFNEDKFKEENPKEYESYLEEKLKKGKAGYLKITPAKKEDE